MMLRTSSNNINPAIKMFWLTVRKNLGLIILSLAISLLICPGYMLVKLNEINYELIIWRTENWIDGITVFSSIMALLGTLVYNIINLSYMFSKKASDVFHSVPLTRVELLFSRALAGLFSTLIPITAIFLSLVFMSAIYGCFMTFIVKILLCFVIILVITLVFWALSVIFAVCAGATFDYILSYVCINAGALLIAYIVDKIIELYLLGYAYDFSTYKLFSPIYYCINSMSLYLNSKLTNVQLLFFLVNSIVLSALMVIISYFLYKKRKAEKAGSAYAYRFIYLVCGFIASFGGAYALGALFSLGDLKTFLFWICAPIGAILTAVGYGAITNRGFKNFKRSIVLGVVSVTTLGILAGMLILDPIGFSRRIPKKENIQCVTLNIANVGEVTYTDNDLPIDLHKRIVDEKLSVASSELGIEEYASVYLEYTLKNGRKVKRSFWVLKSEIENEIYDYYLSDEHFDMIYDRLEENEGDRVFMRYIHPTIYYSGAITKEAFIELLEIYREEISENPDIVNNCGDQSFCFVANWENSMSMYSGDILYMSNKTVKTKAYINSLIKQQKLTT